VASGQLRTDIDADRSVLQQRFAAQPWWEPVGGAGGARRGCGATLRGALVMGVRVTPISGSLVAGCSTLGGL
jgi:hypothetical protein